MLTTLPPASTLPPRCSACVTHGTGNTEEFPAFRRNGPVFLRSNHQHADARICGRDILIQSGPCILAGIKLETEKSQGAASGRSHIGGVLTHTGSEHKRIHSTQHGSHATEGCSQAMYKDVECQ